MLEALHPYFRLIAGVLELLGAAAVLLGVLIASCVFALQGWRAGDWRKALPA